MYVCMYLCKHGRLASGMHASLHSIVCECGNVMRACTNAILVVRQCMVDGWMIVMNGSGDAWFILVTRVIE